MNNLPEISFAEKDIGKILSDMISGYEQAYYEQTGKRKKLYPGDPIRIFLYTQALREIQLRYMIDDAAKQNLLKYARAEYLDHKGNGLATRLPGTKAIVSQKFILSAPIQTSQIIPAGTRVSPGNNIHFETKENVAVPSGVEEITTTVECTTVGVIGNGFTPGQINILVDPIPWVASVINIDTSQGGSEVEDDDSYRERIRLAPESFSVAGPDGAYEFFAKQYSPLVQDVVINSPAPGEVDIRVLLNEGELPSQPFLEGIQTYLSARDKRPLTDYVTVGAPDVVNYDINIEYYIRSRDAQLESSIQAAVNKAIDDFRLWQRSKIGRDVNPSELIARIINTGAKRVEVTSPVYMAIQNTQVANDAYVNVTYGGLEG